MVKILRVILFPVSMIYGVVLAIRNLLFSIGFLKTERLPVKIVSVGNLSVGGTGKTPHVAALADELKEHDTVGILLRGYGRKTQGYLEVNQEATPEMVGDEALIYKNRFGETVVVAVCEQRVDGAKKMLENHPNLSLLILDDAYQHRYIERDVNILLTEYNRPFYNDTVVPSGRLREFKSGKKRADLAIVTKSPVDLNEAERTAVIHRMGMQSTPIFLSSIAYGLLLNLQTKEVAPYKKNILIVTGIANPAPLVEFLQRDANVKLLQFKDHHAFSREDILKIHKLFDTFAPTEKIIVTTEKDAIRLTSETINDEVKKYPWYFQSISVKINNKEALINRIIQHVE